jgi:hypothetical protein
LLILDFTLETLHIVCQAYKALCDEYHHWVLDTNVAEYIDHGQPSVHDEVGGTANAWNCDADESPFISIEHRAVKQWPYLYDSQLSALQNMEGAWTISNTESRIATAAVSVGDCVFILPFIFVCRLSLLLDPEKICFRSCGRGAWVV